MTSISANACILQIFAKSLRKKAYELKLEKRRSDKLILQMLPQKIADERSGKGCG